jgi:hypothetical protein
MTGKMGNKFIKLFNRPKIRNFSPATEAGFFLVRSTVIPTIVITVTIKEPASFMIIDSQQTGNCSIVIVFEHPPSCKRQISK